LTLLVDVASKTPFAKTNARGFVVRMHDRPSGLRRGERSQRDEVFEVPIAMTPPENVACAQRKLSADPSRSMTSARTQRDMRIAA
jgi:hypothetical protein